MSYTNANAFGFEEAERSPLVLVDIRTLRSIIGDVVEKAVQSVGLVQNSTKKDEERLEDGLLGMEETLKLLKVSKVTIHNWKKKGIIKSHKMGRKLYFKRAELMDAIKRQKYSLAV